MVLSGDKYSVNISKDHNLRDYRECSGPSEPETVTNVEKYKIELDTLNPNLPDLYMKIQEVCPEFRNKRSFHLYWKNSESTILPITNYITYVSMVSLIASTNDNLYLVAREWEDKWVKDPAAMYKVVPEDVVLVGLVAPRQSVYTMPEEIKRTVAKSAARVETTRTYSPPRMSEIKKVSKSKEKSPRSKSPKKGNKK